MLNTEIRFDGQLEHSAVVAGSATLAHILLEGLVVDSVKALYDRTTFTQAESAEHMTLQSFEADVLWWHKDEFEACLLYLRDFMQAIDGNDAQTVQGFRREYSEVARQLSNNISGLDFEALKKQLIRMDRAVFKLSNHRLYIELGADPEFKGIDWENQKGNEYLLFEGAINAINLLERSLGLNGKKPA